MPLPDPDSVEIADLIMELQSLRAGEVNPKERERRIAELRVCLAQLGFDDAAVQDWLDRPPDDGGDDDLPAALVRKPRPRGPLGSLGASVHPPGVDTPQDDPCA